MTIKTVLVYFVKILLQYIKKLTGYKLFQIILLYFAKDLFTYCIVAVELNKTALYILGSSKNLYS
jgi:hypothetical protein